MEAVGRRKPRPAVRLPVFPHSRAQSWGPGEVPELFPPLCAAAGLPGLRIGSLGPFSRIINSSLCPAWPIDQPRPPRGLQAPVLHLSSHPSEARPTPPPCHQRVPRSVADVPSPWQPACPVQPGSGCGRWGCGQRRERSSGLVTALCWGLRALLGAGEASCSPEISPC